ncbi:transposase [Cohnella cellulosilytica]|uniref:Transposase n=1 Tax=Cohnella cellulosilytica TaxID=986710 RepID=A0ABW2FK75_9BACL
MNKATYIVIGIDLDGDKDVLGMRIAENNESLIYKVAFIFNYKQLGCYI